MPNCADKIKRSGFKSGGGDCEIPELDQKSKRNAVGSELIVPRRGMTRSSRSRVQRRNTMDCAILNEMFIEEESKRSDKRAQALLRESEREIKISMAPMVPPLRTRNSFHEKTKPLKIADNDLEDEDIVCQLRRKPELVECSNRYMSVYCSRPSGCRISAPPSSTATLSFISKVTCDTNRKEFHETFSNLIKLGNIERTDGKSSNDDTAWQTELKDMIWLELQAWHADRTLEQQDKYLYTARQGIPDLLTQIVNYKFQHKYKSMLSVTSEDSGYGDKTDGLYQSCPGCMSLYCKSCSEQQALALKEVEELLVRLETVEALYPSSQAMASLHPIYKSQKFIGTVKAMCLWYNITKQHRLKLMILGKILARLKGKKFVWPVQTSVTDTSSSSGKDSGNNSVDSTSSGSYRKPTPIREPKVQFQIDMPDESISSTSSASTTDGLEAPYEDGNCSDGPVVGEYTKCLHKLNLFNIEPLACNFDQVSSCTDLLRKYIENVLKSRGLPKSLSFLHKLHNVVLYKAQISLERPGTEDYDFETELFEERGNVPKLEPNLDREQIEELRRYGHWSPEAREIGLPSYVPTFVFLSVIPLQFMHEFLRMRLETRPIKPNPLSLEQLMKELREGLTLALTHRERYQRHINTALGDNEAELEKYVAILDQFDSTVIKVMELYLDYVDQLVLVAARENCQKSALEKEWIFAKLVSPMIPGMHTLAANKFCLIIRNLLGDICDRLVSRCKELFEQIEDTNLHTDAMKWQLLVICRETQSLFTIERERAVKTICFAKTFCKDVEQNDFHREHYDDYISNTSSKTFKCQEIIKSFKDLQVSVLDVRSELKNILCQVQDLCCMKNMSEFDDQDRQAILSRSREILHQGYKFGFEYSRDIIRLFEQTIISKTKDDQCEKTLALGVVEFARMWMMFVTERCERGRGVRPRYASQGLEFLIIACDPMITKHLSDSEFEDLKKKMDDCISHVIGINSVKVPEKVQKKKASPRSRKVSSPAPSRSRTPTRQGPMSAGVVTDNPQQNLKYLQPQFSLRESSLTHQSSIDSIDSQITLSSQDNEEIQIAVPPSPSSSVDSLVLRQIRIKDAVNRLDMELENKLRERNLIGQVKNLNSNDKMQIRARSVSFRWHRGIKIGQGRFGKVYTAVNNSTGELMAMKEITIQPGEIRAIRNVAEELKILEGINHGNLVKYYGIEIHREELLIFMELCAEGTLESLVELSGGLHEGLTRRFTAQLLSGIAELHKHGVVHRDIKTANIFLWDGGNSLKLGDFGSAVKIQAHTTVPGELQGMVGTQAYMAPEIFTKTTGDGHGRSADIWSLGCVVVEMASGKRPWSQFENNFQIMFKVGMGESPEIPDSLSQEGKEFVEKCLQHDPRERATALELKLHNFCKVSFGEENSHGKPEVPGRRKSKY